MLARARNAAAILMLAALPACRDAMTANVTTAARVGDQELTVLRLGEIAAQGKGVILRREVIERMASLWVDYVLYAERIVRGDSLLDSASVLTAMWPDVQERLADEFHEKLVAGAAKLDSAQVDSIYAAGEWRLILHILVRTNPTMSPTQRAARREEAQNMQRNLAEGAPWARANQRNDDPDAKARGGSLGVIRRGSIPEFGAGFENAAFALGPGEMSDVVESQYGYHILARPRLQDARAQFAAGATERTVERLDSLYLSELGRRYELDLRGNAVADVRKALATPARYVESGRVIGTYRGGKFTVADFVRWLQLMPPQWQQQAASADDQQLVQFVLSLMRNAVLLIEADSAGVKVTPLDLQEFQEGLRRHLKRLWEAMRVDTVGVGDSTVTPSQRLRLAAIRAEDYLEATVNDRNQFVPLPALLTARLRQQGDWRVVWAGVDRALDRARELRLAADGSITPIPGGGDQFLTAPSDTGANRANP